jgi:hypothetical protein
MVGKAIEFDFNALLEILGQAHERVEQQLQDMDAAGDKISISNMFRMQMLMNKLSQLSEMMTGIVSAVHTACSSMARNVKA